MGRRKYLVTYDVTDDKRRARTFDILSDMGDHVQYSVFMCELSARELLSLKARITEEIAHADDQVLIVDLGPADAKAADVVVHIGRALAVRERVNIV